MTTVYLFSRLYIICQGSRHAHLVEPDEALLVEELETLLLRGLLVDLVHLGRALGQELRREVQKAVPRVPDHDHGDDVMVGGTLNWWNLQQINSPEVFSLGLAVLHVL